MGMNLGLNALACYLVDHWLGGKNSKRRPRNSEPSEFNLESLEVLEDRQLLTVFTVTTAQDETTDNSTTSLREAIAQANANPGADEIQFNSNQNGQRLYLTQGELVISDAVTITGLGSFNTVIDGQLNSRVFNILDTAGDVNLNKLTVAQGKTFGFNGKGGGILSSSGGALTMIDSTVIGNFTTGVYAQGGGIFSYTGSVTLINSTVSGNGTTNNYAPGGGVATGTGDLTLINSTISGNVTLGANSGGGGIATYAGNLKLTNTTVAFNGTNGFNSSGGGIFSGSTGLSQTNAITLNNSIVAGNRITSGPKIDISKGAGTTAFIVNNSLIAINDGTGLAAAPLGSPDANGNLIGTFASPIDPQLAPLAPNGGTTRTHALLSTSPAIDAGDNDYALNLAGTALTTDQSARLRSYHGTVDMGAYELQTVGSVPTASFSVAAQSANEAAGVVTLTVTLSAASTKDISIPFTVSGTATDTTDYTLSSNTLVIPAGATTGSIPITILNDTDVEATETAIVTLGTPTNATLGGTTSETLSILDNDSAAPATISLTANTVRENAANAVVGTLSAVNPNSSVTPTFSILPGGQGSLFKIVGSQLKVGATGLNYESLPGGIATVMVRARNANGTFLDKQFSIVITDVNDAPSIAAGQILPGSASLTAGSVVGTVVATDPDTTAPFNTLTYSISNGNANRAFAINPTTGQITLANPSALSPTASKATLQIKVSDGGSPSLFATQSVTIKLVTPFTMKVSSTIGRIATTLGATVPLDATAALINVDPSASLTNAKITISETAGGSTKDLLFLKTGGTVSLLGTSVRVNGVAVGTIAGGTAGTPLTITFTAGSVSTINAILSRIAIQTTKITGAQPQRTINFSVAVGSFTSAASVRANVVNS